MSSSSEIILGKTQSIQYFPIRRSLDAEVLQGIRPSSSPTISYVLQRYLLRKRLESEEGPEICFDNPPVPWTPYSCQEDIRYWLRKILRAGGTYQILAACNDPINVCSDWFDSEPEFVLSNSTRTGNVILLKDKGHQQFAEGQWFYELMQYAVKD